jgi:CheY-like chemotaxis protein
MPVMDGLEASRHIRAYQRAHNLLAATIVALTGLASESVQREAFASGINLFLTKPVRLKELGEIIKKKMQMGAD